MIILFDSYIFICFINLLFNDIDLVYIIIFILIKIIIIIFIIDLVNILFYIEL